MATRLVCAPLPTPSKACARNGGNPSAGMEIQAKLILMFQLDDLSPRLRENVGHRSRRYRNRDVASHMDVASQSVCDVAESIPDTARTNNKSLRRRRISAFLPQQAAGYPAEVTHERIHVETFRQFIQQ